MKYDRVIFDVDGTLVDSKIGIFGGVKCVLKEMNLPEIDDSILNKFIGTPLLNAFIDLIGLDEENAKEAVKIFRKNYSETFVLEFGLFDGMVDLIKELKEKGATVCIASSKPTVFIHRIIEKLGIADCFTVVSGTGLDKNNEGKKDILKRALVDGEKAVIVGDRIFDVKSAKDNGIDCIGVLYGYGAEEEFEGAVAKCRDVKELRDFLLN